MNPGLLDNVRTACQKVAGQARFVTIDTAKIPGYAQSISISHKVQPELDPTSHYLGRGDDTLSFFLVLDAINFGSGYFPHLMKLRGKSGYFTVATHLSEHYRRNGPITPDQLATITASDCTMVFNQDPSNRVVQELMHHFAVALNDLGHLVHDRYNGKFSEVISSANSSAVQLVNLLADMPYFRDVELYEGMQVPFFKRAQLTAADLSLAFNGEGYGRFEDLDRLTIFADNLVPHVLRLDGILVYEEELASRIDGEELIPAGSLEEIELRACAVHAVELLRKALRETGRVITSMDLDYILWNRGQRTEYKAAKPRHRTRTVFY